MKKCYAGIGSRKTPENILKVMTKIGQAFESVGYTLRSGGALGADSSFEKKVTTKEIFTAKDATHDSLTLAEKFHPNWSACSDYAKNLHARNGLILLGLDLKTPVDFIVCWTEQGKVVGGTGQALRIAEAEGIKIYNLFFEKDLEELNILYKNLKNS